MTLKHKIALLFAGILAAASFGIFGAATASAGPPATQTCSTSLVGGFPNARASATCTAPASSGFDTFRIHATCYVPPFTYYTVTGPWVSVKGGTSLSSVCVGGSISSRYVEFLT